MVARLSEKDLQAANMPSGVPLDALHRACVTQCLAMEAVVHVVTTASQRSHGGSFALLEMLLARCIVHVRGHVLVSGVWA